MSAMAVKVPSPARTLGTLIWAEAIAFTRSWRSVMWTVALPVLMLLLSSNRGATQGKAVLVACAVALVTGTFSLGIMGYGVALAAYRERGVFRLLRCSPAPASQLLVARLLVQLLAVLAEGVVVLVAARLLFGIAIAPAHVVMMFGLLLLAGLAALALGQAVAAFTRDAAATTAVSRVLLIVLLVLEVSGISRNWPDWLQQIVGWSPVKLAQELLTAALVGGRLDAAYVGALAIWILVVGYAGLHWFHWEQN